MADGDLALNPSGDIYFDSDGNLVVATGINAVVLDVASRLRFFLGEDPLDVDGTGTPWLQDVLGQKGVDSARLASIVEQQILQTPDVLSVDSLDVTFDRQTRTVTVSWVGETTFGSTPYPPAGVLIPLP